MVELGQGYNIARVELYNRPGLCGEVLCYGRLAKITILTNARPNPEYPNSDTNDWTVQSYHEAPYGPVGIIQFSSPIFARNVVVSSANSGVALSLVEVEVYTSMFLTRVLKLQLTSDSTDCIKLSWQEPENIGGRVIRYEYICTNYIWTVVDIDAFTATACGYTKDTNVTCSVSAVVAGGASQEETATLYTGSTNVAFQKSSSQKNTNGSYSADRATNGILDDFTLTRDDGNNWWMVNLGRGYFIARVELYNRPGISGEVLCLFLTRVLNLQLTSNSTDCITLSWQEPENIGGRVIRYEYICTNYNWTVVDIKAFTATACGYTNDTNVTCSVSAVVAGGASQEETATLYTGSTNVAYRKSASQKNRVTLYSADRATNGILDGTVDFTHTTHDGNNWWMVELGQGYNIARVELYNRPGYCGEGLCYGRLANITILTNTRVRPEYPYPDTNRWTAQSYHEASYGPVGIIQFRSLIFATNVVVSSANSGAPLSLVEVEVYTSMLLTRVLNLQLTSDSTDCIILSWQEPENTGGRVIRYEYKCTNNDWTLVKDDTNAVLVTLDTYKVTSCGYKPYTYVTCSVSAVVQGGASQEESNSAHTASSHCSPSQSVNGAQASTTHKVRVGDEVLYACEKGKYQTGGDNKLTCVLNDEGEAEWSGSALVCSDVPPDRSSLFTGLSIALSAAVVTIALLTGWNIRLKRHFKLETPNLNMGAVGTEFEEFLPETRRSNANMSRDSEYEEPDGESASAAVLNEGEAYEMISDQLRGPEHIYTAANEDSTVNYENLAL